MFNVLMMCGMPSHVEPFNKSTELWPHHLRLAVVMGVLAAVVVVEGIAVVAVVVAPEQEVVERGPELDEFRNEMFCFSGQVLY